jgi:DnaJ-class molecular chaperone
MTQEDNLYKVLGVNASASQSEIKEAYRKLSMKTHPDRKGDTKVFQKVKESYDILSNPNKRSRYDIMFNLVRISGPNIQVVDDDKGIKFDIKQGMGTVTITSK